MDNDVYQSHITSDKLGEILFATFHTFNQHFVFELPTFEPFIKCKRKNCNIFFILHRLTLKTFNKSLTWSPTKFSVIELVVMLEYFRRGVYKTLLSWKSQVRIIWNHFIIPTVSNLDPFRGTNEYDQAQESKANPRCWYIFQNVGWWRRVNHSCLYCSVWNQRDRL